MKPTNKPVPLIARNKFHNTEARLVLQPISEGRFSGMHRFSSSTSLRLRRELCPSRSECKCSGDTGEYGSRRLAQAIINEDGDRNFIVDVTMINAEAAQ